MINAALYGTLKVALPSVAFLDRMAICFGVVLAVLAVLTLINPLKEPVKLPVNHEIALESSPSAKILGWVVVALTLVLYVIFW